MLAEHNDRHHHHTQITHGKYFKYCLVTVAGSHGTISTCCLAPSLFDFLVRQNILFLSDSACKLPAANMYRPLAVFLAVAPFLLLINALPSENQVPELVENGQLAGHANIIKTVTAVTVQDKRAINPVPVYDAIALDGRTNADVFARIYPASYDRLGNNTARN